MATREYLSEKKGRRSEKWMGVRIFDEANIAESKAKEKHRTQHPTMLCGDGSLDYEENGWMQCSAVRTLADEILRAVRKRSDPA